MHYSLRQPVSDKQTGTRGSSIFSNKEWDVLGCDLKLSPRALPLVRGIFDDKTEEGIAYDLRISVHTVHSYLIRIYQTLGVHSREELLVYVFGRYLERHRLPKSQRSAGQGERATKPRVRLELPAFGMSPTHARFSFRRRRMSRALSGSIRWPSNSAGNRIPQPTTRPSGRYQVSTCQRRQPPTGPVRCLQSGCA